MHYNFRNILYRVVQNGPSVRPKARRTLAGPHIWHIMKEMVLVAFLILNNLIEKEIVFDLFNYPIIEVAWHSQDKYKLCDTKS